MLHLEGGHGLIRLRPQRPKNDSFILIWAFTNDVPDFQLFLFQERYLPYSALIALVNANENMWRMEPRREETRAHLLLSLLQVRPQQPR